MITLCKIIKRAIAIGCLLGLILLSASTSADIAVVVNKNNPIEKLSKRDVMKIFMGKSRLWPGTRNEIIAYDLSESESVKNEFYYRLVRMGPLKLARYRASYLFSGKGRLPVDVTSAQLLKKFLEEQPNGIGYVDEDGLNDGLKVVYTLRTGG